MIPEFKYHPDPFKTKIFERGEPCECECCGKMTDVGEVLGYSFDVYFFE